MIACRGQNTEEETLRSFYANYITTCSSEISGKQFVAKVDSICNHFCTSRLSTRIHDLKINRILDYDPFLCAQYCSIEWLKSLSIKRDLKRSNLFIVSFKQSSDEIVRVKIIMIPENGQFKIDYVNIQVRIDNKYETLAKDGSIVLKE
jgi:hypothetical protein